MRLASKVFVIGLLLCIGAGAARSAASKYRWKKGAVTIAISTSVTSPSANISSNSDITASLDQSLNSWQRVANITLRAVSSVDQSVSPAGAQGDGISLITIAATPENLAMFPQGLDDAAARTRVFYDARGFITEADVVLNPFLQFSTDGTLGTFDLESTITHELGHLLGLGHSPVLGATMSENYGRNGVYNLPAFAARTLASDDIAAIRSLYGPAVRENDCCGKFTGRLTLANGRPAVGFTVWAEDSGDGRVIAAASTGSDGSFRIGGLPEGKAIVYAQGGEGAPLTAASQELGDFQIVPYQTVSITRRLDRTSMTFRPEYMGFNGQLAELAIPVNAGSTYSVLVGGPNSTIENLFIGGNSNSIMVQRRPTRSSFTEALDTLGFEVMVAGDAAPGEYSLFIRSETGERRYLIGGLTVEKFSNLWSISNFK